MFQTGDINDLLSSFLANREFSKLLVLTDTNTNTHCLPIISDVLQQYTYDVIEIDAGEESKQIDIVVGVWRTMLDFEADRNTLLLNLGGGVVTDLGGFAAATYKRGIQFANIPTTLVGMVDAAIGGKTGIDVDVYKNMVGTFTMPETVLIDTIFLNSLPKRELAAGYAEVVKHGLIAGGQLYTILENSKKTPINIDELVGMAAEVKSQIVQHDATEQNIRKTLNFGHTIGHAIESYSLVHDAHPLLHGEAVAIGMWVESYLSLRNNTLSGGDFLQVENLLHNYFPNKYEIHTDTFAALIEIMNNDKKNVNGQIGFALLTGIGRCEPNAYFAPDAIMEALHAYIKL